MGPGDLVCEILSIFAYTFTECSVMYTQLCCTVLYCTLYCTVQYMGELQLLLLAYERQGFSPLKDTVSLL